MADTSGQAEIRGLNIDKLAKGFADEEFIFKRFLTITPTSSREIRWYMKTSGVLDSTDTSGITASQIKNTAHLAMPVVVEQSWTRMTSYVRKYFVESPWMSFEDIKDSDPDILATNVRDLTRAVANQVDQRIYETLSGSLALSGTSLGTGWDDGTNGNPILDLLSGSEQIRGQNYDISNLVVLMHPTDYKKILNWIITEKGSSIPAFSSEKVRDGVLMQVVGQRIVVSNNCTNGFPVQIVPRRVATWKTFTPITARAKEEVGIGLKIRVWEEGEILLTDNNAGHVVLNSDKGG
jgi:hypothetical protein